MRGEVTLRRLLQPFEKALAADGTREVVVNRPGEFGVEGGEGWEWFEDDRITPECLDAIGILALRGKFDPVDHPAGSGRLPDGQRITVTRMVEGDNVSVTIRKPPLVLPTLAWLQDRSYFSFLNPQVDWVETLTRWVAEDRLNIEITAATGGSKTTLLTALCQCISEEERTITLESVPEIFMPNHRNWLPIVYEQGDDGPRTAEKSLEVALRQRPDRIVVGETRTGETWGMLRALNSGHRGGMSTTHANPGRQGMEDALFNQASQSKHTNGMSEGTIRRMIRDNIHALIEVERRPGEAVPYRAVSIERFV